jgi:DNA polymerase-3 subunit epsilon
MNTWMALIVGALAVAAAACWWFWRSRAQAASALAELEQQLRSAQADAVASEADLAQSRNRLAALVGGLPQGVIVCSADHRIVSCNERVVQLLGAAAAQGQPVFSLIEEDQVLHALDRLGRPRGNAAPVQWITSQGGRSLRVMMAGVPGGDATTAGYVLVIEDVTRSVEMEQRRESLLQELSEGSRASLGNIRAAIETMLRFPDMTPDRRAQFSEVIRQEGEHMSQRLGTALRQAESPAASNWPLEDLPADDLGDLLRMALERRLHRKVGRSHAGSSPHVVVDSQGLVRCMGDLAAQLIEHLGLPTVAVQTESAGCFVRLALCWNGPPLDAKTLHAWRQQPLEQVLLRHGAELWAEFDGAGSAGRLCLQLPAPMALSAA